MAAWSGTATACVALTEDESGPTAVSDRLSFMPGFFPIGGGVLRETRYSAAALILVSVEKGLAWIHERQKHINISKRMPISVTTRAYRL